HVQCQRYRFSWQLEQGGTRGSETPPHPPRRHVMAQVTGAPLNADDVARELQQKRDTILRWARDGELPMYKVGRTCLINPDTFDQWKRARQVGLAVTRAS